jgi:Flp pilus assembly protein TadB
LCAIEGGAVGESLDRCASAMRERSAAVADRRVHAAQARLSAKVLTLVPLGFSAWTLTTDASVRRFATTLVGLCCIACGVALNYAGWQLMRRQIERVT